MEGHTHKANSEDRTGRNHSLERQADKSNKLRWKGTRESHLEAAFASRTSLDPK